MGAFGQGSNSTNSLLAIEKKNQKKTILFPFQVFKID